MHISRAETDPTAHILVQYLAPGSCSTLALIVIHFHEQIQWLGLLCFIDEASRVHFALDGGVPVILHSIVSPTEKAEENKKLLLSAALKHS